MRRLFLAIAISSGLFSIGTSARAGDYYGEGYYGPRYSSSDYDEGYSRPRYSHSYSSCCYRKITRYERINNGYSDYSGRSSYYGGGYSYRPRYYSHYERPRYDDSGYYESGWRYGTPRTYYSGGAGYFSDYGYGAYASSCYYARVRVNDWNGGWVWGRKRVCN